MVAVWLISLKKKKYFIYSSGFKYNKKKTLAGIYRYINPLFIYKRRRSNR